MTAGAWQERIANAFDEGPGVGLLTGCVGALDGLSIKIERPSPDEVGDPLEFYNRKGYYALVLQAICDHKWRFLFGSSTEPGRNFRTNKH